MLTTSLLKDLDGWSRWAWRQRAWSAELSRCAITARSAHHRQAISLFLRSLMAWPSPFFLSWRWKALVVDLIRGRAEKKTA